MAEPKTKAVVDQDVFFKGLLAALAMHQQVLEGTRSELHSAFFEAVRAAEREHLIDADALEIDFDPLYEVSPWFDHALTRAQQKLWVSFPNPSYERVQICYDADEAKAVLRSTGCSDKFEVIATTFLQHLQHR